MENLLPMAKNLNHSIIWPLKILLSRQCHMSRNWRDRLILDKCWLSKEVSWETCKKWESFCLVLLLPGLPCLHFSFSINLASGPGDYDPITLHISVRQNQKSIILNTMKDGGWGNEVVQNNSYKEGDTFDIRVRTHGDHFEVSSRFLLFARRDNQIIFVCRCLWIRTSFVSTSIVFLLAP